MDARLPQKAQGHGKEEGELHPLLEKTRAQESHTLQVVR